MAGTPFSQRFVKLIGMLHWAIFDGCFEPDDECRLPLRRALAFASADANILGDLGVRESPCGCQRRFARPLMYCGPHAWEFVES